MDNLGPEPVVFNAITAQGPFAPPRKKKDVIRIPARTGAKMMSKSITRLRVHFDDTGREGQIVAEGKDPTFDVNGDWTSGGWLVHCHILEHSGRGMVSFFEVRDPADPWHLLGKHLAGTHGNPSLTGEAPVVAGTALRLNLVDTLPSSNSFLVLGASLGRLPILGGEIVPGAPYATIPALSDAQGVASWQLAGWEVLPSGVPLWFQAVTPDIGAVQNLAMSNAVKFTRP